MKKLAILSVLLFAFFALIACSSYQVLQHDINTHLTLNTEHSEYPTNVTEINVMFYNAGEHDIMMLDNNHSHVKLFLEKYIRNTWFNIPLEYFLCRCLPSVFELKPGDYVEHTVRINLLNRASLAPGTYRIIMNSAVSNEFSVSN